MTETPIANKNETNHYILGGTIDKDFYNKGDERSFVIENESEEVIRSENVSLKVKCFAPKGKEITRELAE